MQCYFKCRQYKYYYKEGDCHQVFLVLENLRSVMLNDKGPWPI